MMAFIAIIAALRFPLIFLSVIVWLGVAGPRRKRRGGNLLRGLYDLKPGRMWLAFLTSLIISYAVMLCAWVVLMYSPVRLQTVDLPRAIGLGSEGLDQAFLWIAALLVATPSIYGIWKVSTANGANKIWHFAAACIAQITIVSVSTVISKALGNTFTTGNWDNLIGYSSDAGIHFEHLFTAVWGCVVLALYAILGIIRYTRIKGQKDDTAPTTTLIDVHLLLTLLCLGLSGMAFCLDVWRVPVLTCLIIIFGLISWASRPDHFFDTSPIKTPAPLYPKAVLEAGADDTAVIVTASGGGILLAAWTAKVLSELDRIPGFRKRVRLVSSVSGGSVGALYWLQAVHDNATVTDKAFEAAHRSSLDNVAWGLIYPDFLRVFFPFLSRKIDRGWAIEQTWKQGWNFPDKLTEWRQAVKNGKMPAVIFNATAAETGEKIMIATTDLDTPPANLSLRRTFYEIHRNQDLSPVSAARLSATFPIVTPAARTRDGEKIHFVDGGYYDNYGSASVAQWLRDAVPKKGSSKIKRILVIAITGFRPKSAEEEKKLFGLEFDDTKADKKKQAGLGGGWIYQLIAPLKTLFSVRTTSQRSRRHVEDRLLFDVMRMRGITIDSVAFNYPFSEEPLSWHLTEQEIATVVEAWKKSKEKELQVRDFLHKRSPDPPVQKDDFESLELM